MDLYSRATSLDRTRPDPETGPEESMWRLGLGGGSGSGSEVLHPERPGEQDCAYYMRTGTCGFGEKCRYNHPRDRGAITGAGRTVIVEYPERVGQPVCEYYMKTGNCKYGATCKYHHPRQGGGSVHPVSLNYYGYPLRPGQRECSYYMKTGQCKFASTCKFHHPQPGGTSVPSPAPAFYPTVQPPAVPSPYPYPPMASWQVTRPSVMPGSYMQGSYAPMMLSPGVIPVQGWSTYPAPLNPVVSPGSQQTVQPGSLYGLSSETSQAMTAYLGPYTSVSSLAGPSSTTQTDQPLPERPGQPECQYYMRTGDCKYGSNCKYHHPPDWNAAKTNFGLNHLGYPLRPSAQPCSYYIQYGVCKFGPTCKFDHPVGIFSYSPSTSLSDMQVAPYPIGYPAATLAPSSSPLDLSSEFISSNEPTSTRMPSDNISAGSVGSVFPSRSFLPHLIIQSHACTSSSCSSPALGAEKSS